MNDLEIRTFFASNRADLIALRDLAKTTAVTAISCEWIEIENRRKIHKGEPEYEAHLSNQKSAEICAILNRLKVGDGIGIGHGRSSILSVPLKVFGNVSGGYSKGLIYSEAAFEDILPTIDAAPAKRGRYYSRIEDNWYVFLWIDG